MKCFTFHITNQMAAVHRAQFSKRPDVRSHAATDEIADRSLQF